MNSINPILIKLAMDKLALNAKHSREPPNLHKVPILSIDSCAACKYFDGVNRCTRYLWPVDKDESCDSFEPKAMDLPDAPSVNPGTPITNEPIGFVPPTPALKAATATLAPVETHGVAHNQMDTASGDSSAGIVDLVNPDSSDTANDTEVEQVSELMENLMKYSSQDMGYLRWLAGSLVKTGVFPQQNPYMNQGNSINPPPPAGPAQGQQPQISMPQAQPLVSSTPQPDQQQAQPQPQQAPRPQSPFLGAAGMLPQSPTLQHEVAKRQLFFDPTPQQKTAVAEDFKRISSSSKLWYMRGKY